MKTTKRQKKTDAMYFAYLDDIIAEADEELKNPTGKYTTEQAVAIRQSCAGMAMALNIPGVGLVAKKKLREMMEKDKWQYEPGGRHKPAEGSEI